MQHKIALIAAQWLLSYVRKNPEFLDEIAQKVPGKVDDWLLTAIKRLIVRG